MSNDKPMQRNSPTAKGLVVSDERDFVAERERLCGLIDRFAKGGAIVTGVDVAPSAIELARANFAQQRLGGDFDVADGERLPFPDGTFDVVLSSQAIHNIYSAEGRAQAIAEIARVLAPGGRALIRDIRHLDDYAVAFAAHGVTDVRRIGSRVAMVLLAVVTAGSLRPGTLLAYKPA